MVDHDAETGIVNRVNIRFQGQSRKVHRSTVLLDDEGRVYI